MYNSPNSTTRIHYNANVLYNTNTTPPPTRTLTPPNGSQAGAQRERDITTSAHLLRQVGHEKALDPYRTLATRSSVTLPSAPPRDCQGVDLTPTNPTSPETHTTYTSRPTSTQRRRRHPAHTGARYIRARTQDPPRGGHRHALRASLGSPRSGPCALGTTTTTARAAPAYSKRSCGDRRRWLARRQPEQSAER